MNPESNKKHAVRHIEVPGERGGQRLDNFLGNQLKGVPKAAIYRIIRTGQVRVNGKRCKPSQKISVGDDIRIPPVHTSENGPFVVSDAVIKQINDAIIHIDDNYLVINKPTGMAVHSGSQLPWGLIDAVRQSRPDEYVELAHRIDRETSGCIVLARNGQALRHLSEQFRTNRVGKRYLCLLDGKMKQEKMEVDAPLLKVNQGGEHKMEVNPQGKEAQTHFRLLQSFDDSSYAQAELFTGRTHQIRAHAAYLGSPLAGDDRYAKKKAQKKWRGRGLKRLFLHAAELSFEPISGETVSVDAPLPATLSKVLDGLSD